MHDQHGYAVEVQWTGNRGEGTATYRSYGRDHRIQAEGKQHEIAGSSDRVFRGDADRWNPEELVIAALAQCHMLSYLHVAAVNGIVVVDYRDAASETSSPALRPRAMVEELRRTGGSSRWNGHEVPILPRLP